MQTNPNETLNNEQNVAVQTQAVVEKPVMGMTFNTIYAIFLIVCGALSVLSSFANMFMDGGWLLGIWGLLGAIYGIVTGALLLKRTKAGNIMRLLNNIYGCTLAGFFMVCGIFCIAGGSILTSLLEGMEGASVVMGLSVFLGIGMIIGALIGLAGVIVIMIYYKKRKHMFK